MMNVSLIMMGIIIGSFISAMPAAFAQESISVNSTVPCFQNYTAGLSMLSECGIQDDFLAASLLPWEWITGGNFSMVIAGIFVMFTYIKYHKAVYPIIIGTFMLPITFTFFPDSFLSFAVIMAFATIGILIWYVYIRQTKENG